MRIDFASHAKIVIDLSHLILLLDRPSQLGERRSMDNSSATMPECAVPSSVAKLVSFPVLYCV